MVLPASRLFPNDVIVPKSWKRPVVFSSIVVSETRTLALKFETRPYVFYVASEFSTSSCEPLFTAPKPSTLLLATLSRTTRFPA